MAGMLANALDFLKSKTAFYASRFLPLDALHANAM